MRTRNKILIGLVFVIAVGGAAVWSFRGDIAAGLMRSAVLRNMTVDPIGQLPDGLHVGICGSGGPMAGGRSGPCVAVLAGGRLFVVDAGSAAARNLTLMRLPPDRVEAVLMTHFHSDHLDGLGELGVLRWAGGGADQPLTVHGPTGVAQVVDGFNQAYALDVTYRVAHHGADVVPPSGSGLAASSFEPPAPGEAAVLIDDGDLKVTAFAVNHDPVRPAVGYRFDYKGRSATISGDTTKSENLARFAKGTDLLVHEGLSPELVQILIDVTAEARNHRLNKIMRDIPDYHTTPVEAAEVAQASGAGELVFYHVVPPMPVSWLEQVFLEGVSDAYAGPVRISREGDFWTMLPGDDEIKPDRRL